MSGKTPQRKRRPPRVSQREDTTKQLHQNPSVTQGSQQLGASPMLPLYSTEQRSQILAAETFWRAEIRQWFPALHSQTYFVPPVHFNRVSYGVRTVDDLPVLVPQAASGQPRQHPVYFPHSCPPPHPSDPLLASQLVPSGPLPVVYDAYVRGDRAVQEVRDFIQRLTETMTEEERVMVVVSQLQFRKYLDNQEDPITAAAVRLLPRPATLEAGLQRGDFDMLMINGSYSLIVTEVKSVGAGHTSIVKAEEQTDPQEATRAVTKRVRDAIKQLDKAETVLRYLTSDLAPVRITKTLALPNIESTQLEGMLATDQQLQGDLCRCLGVPGTDAATAVSRCLLADDIRSPTSSVWWQRTVTDHGPDTNMTPELYERLAARFCGPATTIEVPTVTTPRRTVGLKTLSEGVAQTGLTMSALTLYPQQVDLVSRPDPLVFLWGPPGTGKTVILVLKGIQWGRQEKDVHAVSTHRHSRAAIMLIEHQLLHAASTSRTAPTSAKGAVTEGATTSATAPTSATGAVTEGTPTSAIGAVTEGTPTSASAIVAAPTSVTASTSATGAVTEGTPTSAIGAVTEGTPTSATGAVTEGTPTSASASKSATGAVTEGTPLSATGAVTEGTPTSASATVAAPTSATAPAAGQRVCTHFYDFENNEGDVEAAVDELTSVAREGELYVVADEAFRGRDSTPSGGADTRGRFTEFCSRLARRVPALHLWAAAVRRDVTAGCLEVQRLTTPVRCTPAVLSKVERSRWINGIDVPLYSSDTSIPAATDGPKVRQLPPHCQWSPTEPALSPGHTGEIYRPETCTRCADFIADLLTMELGVGQPDQPLQPRDVIILCHGPREDLAVVTCLRARGVPVQVVREDDDEAAVRDFALAVRDAVTVTQCDVASGLERRVVLLMGWGWREGEFGPDRLMSMSRCTALLAHIGNPV